jgi:hypothetical protein
MRAQASMAMESSAIYGKIDGNGIALLDAGLLQDVSELATSS